MIDLGYLRSNTAEAEDLIKRRLPDFNAADLLSLDTQSRESTLALEELRAKRKTIDKQIGRARGTGEDASEAQAEAAKLKEQIADAETKSSSLKAELEAALLEIPNIPDPSIPVGGKEANEVIFTHGEVPEFDFETKDHVELAQSLGLIDYERGVKLGGTGSWVYTGLGARLEWAMLNYFIESHVRDGYEFVLPPHVVLNQAGKDSGQFPKFADAVFHIENPDGESTHFLIPTSETAILSMMRDEILDLDTLPLKMCAYTPCYRQETGSYRSEERGTIRGNQFNKVEMFQFTTEEQAEAALDELRQRTEMLVTDLGLHFQTSLLSTGDASASMKKTVDVEVYLPSLGIYKEVSSVSWAGDYQARRAKLRYKDADGKNRMAHTLNGSGLATSRLFPAILEQNQNADGSITVPEVLQSKLGMELIKPAKAS